MESLRKWFVSDDGRKWLADMASILIGALVMVLLCGGMSLYIAWHAPSMTDICQKCGCQESGKGGAGGRRGGVRPSVNARPAR
jgi:hypothetical protein